MCHFVTVFYSNKDIFINNITIVIIIIIIITITVYINIIPIYLPLPASPILTAHPWKARIAVTHYVTCRCSHPIG